MPSRTRHASGGNLLARWTHTYDEHSDWMVQTYFDRVHVGDNSIWQWNVATFDAEFQHRFPVDLGKRHEIIWGLEYRQFHDDTASRRLPLGLQSLATRPRVSSTSSYKTRSRWSTIGCSSSSARNSDATTTAVLNTSPAADCCTLPTRSTRLWAAVSRAVWHPLQFVDDGFAQFRRIRCKFPPGFYFPRMAAIRTSTSCNVISYEMGYRAQPEKTFSYDIALFYHQYEKGFLSPQAPQPTRTETSSTLPASQRPLRRRDADLRPELSPPMTHLRSLAGVGPRIASWAWRCGPTAPTCYPATLLGVDPHNQVRLMSSWDFGSHWQFDPICATWTTCPRCRCRPISRWTFAWPGGPANTWKSP